MRVRLKPDLAKTHDFLGWLKEDCVYHVLSIEQTGNRPHYRIASEQDGTPVLFDCSQFDIVDDAIPSNWVPTHTDAGTEWAPAPWNEPGFWERAFDFDPDALAVYKQEKKKITGQ
jgi:hypothetical protein